MERAARAKPTWMSCRAQSAPFASRAAQAGVAGREHLSDQIPESLRAGPTLGTENAARPASGGP